MILGTENIKLTDSQLIDNEYIEDHIDSYYSSEFYLKILNSKKYNLANNMSLIFDKLQFLILKILVFIYVKYLKNAYI